jgi:Cu+-exporting ATPase
MPEPVSDAFNLPPTVDPVCGTAVAPAASRDRSQVYQATTHYFCSEACRRRFKRSPERFFAHGARVPDPAPTDPTPDWVTPAADLGYVCLMCPEVEVDQPGRCPKCGMALEKATPAAADRTEADLRATTQRLAAGVILTVPLLILSLIDLIGPSRPIASAVGEHVALVAQAALALPVVFWCGWPILVRGWESVRRRAPSMSTLYAIGVLAATTYSLTALAYELSGANPRADVPTLSARDVASQITGMTAAAAAHVTDAQHHLTAIEAGPRLVHPFFATAAAIVVLVLVGQMLELRTARRTGAAVQKLLTLTPASARLVRPDGGEEDLPLSLVETGDRVRVKPGEPIPVDGVILDGTTAVDESALTGEPQRVEKTAGTAVSAGTMNGLGALLLEVTRRPHDTALAQVVHLVGRAQRTRIPFRRTVDRIARWFVPLVLLAAAVTLIGWLTVGYVRTSGDWSRLADEHWVTYAVACAVGVLVVACPAALGLATPTAVVAGVSRAARHGVLFRDAAAIEQVTRVTTVLFDKTGTLTTGKPQLFGIEPGIGDDPDRVLAMAAAVERGSVHPLGLAVVWEAVRRKLDIPVATDVKAVPGRGVRGTVGSDLVVVGNRQFLQEHGVMRELVPAELARHRLYGRGVLMVGVNDRCIGLIVVQDPIRPTAKEAVTRVKEAGLTPVLVSGDHPDTAKAVAREVGIEEVIADTPPAEKFAVVRRYQNQNQRVAMTGDGVNDAPALAAADVGIAMGTGTAVAITTAGVTLAQPDLRGIIAARKLGEATVRTIRQNLVLAFAFNVLAIPAAAGLLIPFGGGMISPVWAAAAMSVSTVSIVLNSWRLGRAR